MKFHLLFIFLFLIFYLKIREPIFSYSDITCFCNERGCLLSICKIHVQNAKSPKDNWSKWQIMNIHPGILSVLSSVPCLWAILQIIVLAIDVILKMKTFCLACARWKKFDFTLCFITYYVITWKCPRPPQILLRFNKYWFKMFIFILIG